MGVVGRTAEVSVVRGLVAAAIDGQAGVLVIRGEPGIGKTVLLEEAAAAAGQRVRVLRAIGNESERDLDYAALHQLLLPLLSDVDALPPVQQAALARIFGQQEGPPADRFLVGLATLNLLGSAAAACPLLVICDDVQWFDQTTVETIAFAGRRLAAERLALLLAERDNASAGSLLDHFPLLQLARLSETDALTVLAGVTGASLEHSVARRIVELARGNPLALTHFAADADPDGLLLGDPLPLSGQLEARYRRQVNRLTVPAQQLLLIAAADAAADPPTVRAAAAHLLTTAELVVAEAELAGRDDLFTMHPVPRFRHPLVRSAVYGGADPALRRRTHAALAAVIDTDRHFERHARHVAGAADGVDEQVARHLDRASGRAGERGAYLTAAAFAAQAAGLSAAGPSRDARYLIAAGHAHNAGALQRAEALRGRATGLDHDTRNRALSSRLHGLLLGFQDQTAALRLLGDAATTFAAERDADTARECLIDAFDIVQLHVPRPDRDTVTQLAGLALDLTGPSAESATWTPEYLRLLHGTAICNTSGYTDAAPLLRTALAGLAEQVNDRTPPGRWYLIALQAAHELWDDAILEALSAYVVRTGRASNVRMLSIGLAGLAHHAVMTGRLASADEHWAQYRDIYEALTGTPAFPMVDVLVRAWQGRRDETEAIAVTTGALPLTVPGGPVTLKTRHALTVARLGDQDWRGAFEVARAVFDDDPAYDGTMILPDLVEAAVRAGERDLAQAALRRLRLRARAAGTPGAISLLVRAEALCAHPADAEARYIEAVTLFEATPLVLERARTRLLYGEWLRRRRRRADARQQLHTALRTFTDSGAAGFAQRAQTELIAAGGRVGAEPVVAAGTPELTAQEARVARLAAAGATNQEIAMNLVVSPATVDYHLRKIFKKLGVGSRRHLAGVIYSTTASTE
ncbi:AAA family ATPase [Micromonospora sp. CA-259024]|uniref:helix-turn-helix transcriptional regulator n=1 Tax=Micromonospora sp. CA-259024 TaxID=3239965 RepID=UPI003D925EFF